MKELYIIDSFKRFVNLKTSAENSVSVTLSDASPGVQSLFSGGPSENQIAIFSSAPELFFIKAGKFHVDVIFHFLGCREAQDVLADLFSLTVAYGPDEPLDAQDRIRVHGELVNSEAQQYERVFRLACHLAADAHGNAGLVSGLDHAFYNPQDRRVERLVQVCHMLVHPVYGKRVLKKVVGADGDEAHFLDYQVRYHCGRRDLYHDAHLDVRVEGLSFALELPLALLEYLLGAPDLLYAGDHREHDLYVAIGAGAQDPPE